MSTRGVEKESANQESSLNSLISGDKKEEALSVIKSGKANLFEKDGKGYQPIHWAAIKGSFTTFKALINKGVSAHTADDKGYIPIYHALTFGRKKTNTSHEKIVKYYDEHFPAEFPEDQGGTLSQEINHDLRMCGLDAYTMQDAPDLPYVLRLFAVAPTTIEPKTSKTKPDFKKQMALRINPAQLTLKAHGITEFFTPTEILVTLTKHYPNMNEQAKLACIYFVKEIIRLDGAKDWIDNPEFEEAFTAFLNNLNQKMAFVTLKIKLQNFYQHQLNKLPPYLNAAAPLEMVRDLAKVFTEATLAITPERFRAINLLKKAKDNQPFLQFSDLVNQTSQLVCRDILCARSQVHAETIFKFYMDVLKICLNENNAYDLPVNLPAATAIYLGFQNKAVSRLSFIKNMMNDIFKKEFAKYDILFAPSLSELSSSMKATQGKCVPMLTVYTDAKNRVLEQIPADQMDSRITAFGKINEEYAKHHPYLQSFPVVPYMTDFHDRVTHIHFTDTDAYWLSYTLEPARIINLDHSPSVKDIWSALKYCKDVESPFVVLAQGVKHLGTDAKTKIEDYLALQTLPNDNSQESSDLREKLAAIPLLCQSIFAQYEATRPSKEMLTGKSRIKPALTKSSMQTAIIAPAQVESLSSELSILSLDGQADSPRHSASPKHKRRASATTSSPSKSSRIKRENAMIGDSITGNTTSFRERSQTAYALGDASSSTVSPPKKKRSTSDSHETSEEQPMLIEEATAFIPYYDQTKRSASPAPNTVASTTEEKTPKGIAPMPSPLY
ncbi:RasGEF domain-containing protein [Candidatus Berkiella aquae]|uniref:Ankyrin repeat domain-containing protein n=1 Tax=Candidatus Berkiella aquae TaxID=295108 RepID=A0A0Q9YPN3_9GAMM|nr:RasGEF domain-containing protein [Candidatus Berkiella aquae]MCS5711872.1 ankyrin repeat domain-containing protein [Candidatus Berkiella aquae]